MRMMRRRAKVAPYRYCLISSIETFKALCSSSGRAVMRIKEDSGLFLYITETENTEINHTQNDCFNLTCWSQRLLHLFDFAHLFFE